jgi:hypothetical protein
VGTIRPTRPIHEKTKNRSLSFSAIHRAHTIYHLSLSITGQVLLKIPLFSLSIHFFIVIASSISSSFSNLKI